MNTTGIDQLFDNMGKTMSKEQVKGIIKTNWTISQDTIAKLLQHELPDNYKKSIVPETVEDEQKIILLKTLMDYSLSDLTYIVNEVVGRKK